MKSISTISAASGDKANNGSAQAHGTFSVRYLACMLMALLLSTALASAQRIDTVVSSLPQGMYDTYIQKYKTTKTTAWLLLAPGATMATIRGAINISNGNSFFKYGFNPGKGHALGFIGSVMALSSFPFFISAGNSRKRACLSLKREKVISAEKGPGNFHYLAVKLTIKF